MGFEGRELKPYAEPVASGDLQEGFIYFAVQFADQDMLIPIVQTLVFVGRDRSPGYLRFQTIDSYNEGLRYESATEEERSSFLIQSEDQLSHIFDYEHALDELMKCAFRRKKALG